MNRPCFLAAFLLVLATGAFSQANFWEQLPLSSGSVYASANGTVYVLSSTLSRSFDHGATWETLPLPSAYGYYAFFADTQGTMFLGADGHLLTSTNAGAAWNEIALPSATVSEVYTFAMDGQGDYFVGTRDGSGNGALYVSNNRGVSWITVKNVTRWLKIWKGGDRFIYSMITAPSGQVFMGTRYGGAQVSFPGSPWAKFLGLPRSQFIVFGQSDDAELIAVSRSTAVKSSGNVYTSRDGGFRWKKLNQGAVGVDGGLMAAAKVNGVYYAGTWNGAYVSTDNGATWVLRNSGFPPPFVPVEKIVESGGYLFTQGAQYVYRSVSPVAPSTRPRVPVSELPAVPAAFALEQNFPNPFNPTTTIPFELKEDAMVSITVHDALGRTVATLADEESFGEGPNEVSFDASGISSGLYYYRIRAVAPGTNHGAFTATRKMLLVR